jgi:hypothetical protein
MSKGYKPKHRAEEQKGNGKEKTGQARDHESQRAQSQVEDTEAD